MASLLLPELDLRNVLNVVEENFQKRGLVGVFHFNILLGSEDMSINIQVLRTKSREQLKAYAVRIIYIGEHALNKSEISEHFLKSVKAVNASYCEINIHGFLLVYDSYFVHILEGSEDTVHRQIRFLFKREEDWIREMEKKDEEGSLEVIMDEDQPKKERTMFRRLKMLMMYHSISTTIFDQWRSVPARPPSLVGKLNLHGPLQEHMEQLRICLDKITKLCNLAKADDNLCFEGLPTTDPRNEALPEVALLDFLLQSPYVLDLRHIAHMHRRVDDYYFYFEHVWPVPTHFTPRFLYKLKVDDSFVEPLPVMPWELVKKEEKEGDEQEERQSASTDSD